MTDEVSRPPQLHRIVPVGEDGLLVEFAAEISPTINRAVRRLSTALEQSGLTGVLEIVPAYRSLLVSFDSRLVELSPLRAAITAIAETLEDQPLPPSRLFRLPTVYGGSYGPDLDHVCNASGLAADEVIDLFSRQRFPVCCLGFLCCLAYLGGVPHPLQLPRRATPRLRVPAGAVGIANAQAVVLPIELPSGFHYLGRTFVSLYDPQQFPPTPIRPGDVVEFPAVSAEAAQEWTGQFPGVCDVDRISNSGPGLADDHSG